MYAFYADHFVLPLPETHRFPMSKYSLLRARLLEQGILEPQVLHEAPAANDEQLLRVHTVDYLERVKQGGLTKQETRRIGFPWSLEMVERSRRSTGATIAAAHAALTTRIGINLAGGTHHSFADCGEGYCVFNDVACASRDLQQTVGIAQVLVIDCDVHQGNGTAAIFADDPSVFTFSIHGAKNFPLVGLWILPCLLVALVLFAIGLPAGFMVGLSERGLALFLVMLNGLSGADPWFSALSAPALPAPGLAAIVIAAIGALWLLAPRGWPMRPLGAVLLLPLLWPAGRGPGPGEFELTVPDLGDGQAVIVRTAGGVMLYGAGPGDGAERSLVSGTIAPLVRTTLLNDPHATSLRGCSK